MSTKCSVVTVEYDFFTYSIWAYRWTQTRKASNEKQASLGIILQQAHTSNSAFYDGFFCLYVSTSFSSSSKEGDQLNFIFFFAEIRNGTKGIFLLLANPNIKLILNISCEEEDIRKLRIMNIKWITNSTRIEELK